MPLIDVSPLFLEAVTLRIDADNYEQHVSGVSFVPSPASPAVWTGLGGNTHTATSGAAPWTCQLNYVQDWETDDSLSRYLHEHAGERVPVSFTPLAGGDTFYATITLVPGAIGGEGQAYATTSVTCGSTRPTTTAP